MRPLAVVTGRDPAGPLLTFTLLSADPCWHGQGAPDAPEIAQTLSSMFPLRDLSPGDGARGARQAVAAARWVKAVLGCTEVSVRYPQGPAGPTPEGLVY